MNWKLIATVAAVVVLVVAVAPGTAVAALPLLLILVCPLAMWLGMKAMGGASRPAGDEIAQLRLEIAQLRAERDDVGGTR